MCLPTVNNIEGDTDRFCSMSQSTQLVETISPETNSTEHPHLLRANQISSTSQLQGGVESIPNLFSVTLNISEQSSHFGTPFESDQSSELENSGDPSSSTDTLVSTQSPNSSAFFSTQSIDPEDICVVCMDRRRDIALEPCGHTACCAACFMRLESKKCPVCRTQAEAAHFLGTNRKFVKHRFCQEKTPGGETTADILGDVEQQPRSMHIFHLPPQYGAHHGGPSMLSIASQAPYSTRDRTSSQTRAFLSIESAPIRLVHSSDEALPPSREPSYLTPRVSSIALDRSEGALISNLANAQLPPFDSDQSDPNESAVSRNQSAPAVSAMPSAVLLRPRLDTEQSAFSALSTTSEPRNVILLGSSSSLMLGLITKLQSIFRPPLWESQSIYRRDPTLLYINNQPLRCMLLERTSDTLNVSTFTEEINRYAPKMILLCADFFSLTSFEAVVRLDMEFIDSLNITCFWVIIKYDRGRDRRREQVNQVEAQDVGNAQHYLGVTRRWFVPHIDRVFASDVKRLGREVYDVVWKQTETQSAPSSGSLGTRRKRGLSFRSFFSKKRFSRITRAR